MVSIEWEAMTLDMTVTQQVNITKKCWSDPPKKKTNYKPQKKISIYI